MVANSPAKSHTEHDLSVEVALKAPPMAVWNRLVAFGDYAAWRAPIRIHGEAQPFGAVAYSVRARFTGAGDRWTNFSGRITAFEPGRRLRLQVGYRFWLRIDLEFVLQSARSGTSVQHRARLSGVLSALGGRRLRKVFAAALQSTAAALKITDAAAVSTAPADPLQNRKARRAQRTRRS